jgi:DNA-directed RNA polymerase omega subunit
MKLIEGFDSNYRYILVAARRARQLQNGAPPVIDTGSRKPCRIAQDEIKAQITVRGRERESEQGFPGRRVEV